jgi:sedoheptulose-bisphosphatase
LAVYGPRTTITLAISNVNNAHEFLLVDDFSSNHGQWLKTNEFSTIDGGKLIAPGNLRATQDNPGYQRLFEYWMAHRYQVRYTGGMVPDVNQLLVKGKGIFVNPASPSIPPKLRLLYEVVPLAYIVEKAAGRSSNGEESLLNVEIRHTEMTSQVALGSAEEVARFEQYVGRKYLYL